MGLPCISYLAGGCSGGILGTLKGKTPRMLLFLQPSPLHPFRPSATLGILHCQPSLVRGCPSPSTLVHFEDP